MSAEITSAVWGISPWSDELLKISGDIRRGRTDESAYAQQQTNDFDSYHEALETASITYSSGDWGGGTMLDYLRGIVKGSRGFQEGVDDATLARWTYNNTFFHQPKIEGPLSLAGPQSHEPYQRRLGDAGSAAVYQPTLLSPYAFARLSARDNDVSETDAHRFVGELYDELLDDAADQDVTHVLFHEPYAAYHQIDKLERSKLKHDIGNLAANHPSLKVGVYFSFGDGAEFIRDFAADERLEAIGCDLQKTPITDLIEVPGHRFLAGLVDGANTLIRDDEEITGQLEELDAVIEAPEISVTHTVDLEHVPRAYAIEKISQIGRIAQAAGGKDE